jgi:pimeloyl-ACP methyl ester carboxylesterase
MPSLRTSDGRRLFYSERGEGRPLVCHPGGPGLSGSCLGDLGGLDGSCAIVALDPRGAGRSDPPGSDEAYGLDDYVADLARLQEHLGLARIDLLGHSHGSLVALLYAARNPDRVGRLVLVAVGSRFREEELQSMREAMRLRSSEAWFDDAWAAVEEEQQANFHDDTELTRLFVRELPFYFAQYGRREQAFVPAMLAQPLDAAALRYFNANEFLTFDLRPAMPDVTASTLVIAGREDFILGPRACREVADGIASARLVVLDDAGHFPWVERPKEFVSAVSAFLQA